MNQTTELPSGLHKLAAGRDLISTDEYATVINKASQTVRKTYCLTGEAFGIRPIKVGNRLLWNVEDVAKVLRGEK
jgi:hypothetical protein